MAFIDKTIVVNINVIKDRIWPGRLHRWVEGPGGVSFRGDKRYAVNWLWSSTSGNDTITGDGAATTRIWGGSGNDSLSAGAGLATILGNSGNDYIRGSNYNDSLDGQWNNDTIWAGGGNDTINDDYGTNYIYGGDGNDRILANSGSIGQVIRGDAGNDLIAFSAFYGSVADGGAGNDIITGNARQCGISGGSGNDKIRIYSKWIEGDGPNYIYGNDGNDTIELVNGAYEVWGGIGADTMSPLGDAGATFYYESFSEGGDVINWNSGNGNPDHIKIDISKLVSKNGDHFYTPSDDNDHRQGALHLYDTPFGGTFLEYDGLDGQMLTIIYNNAKLDYASIYH